MKNVGIIDIGSNSVRLLFDGKKYVHTTQLGEGLLKNNFLNAAAMERTKIAIVDAYNFAMASNAKKVYAFATEAVRSATNSQEFVSMLAAENIYIDVIDKETEAKIGFLGAYDSGSVAVLDIGGASSELAVGNSNGLSYSFSLPYGCVRLKEYESDNFDKLFAFVKTIVKSYGEVPHFDKLITIGGTSSTIVAINLKMEVYDTTRVHNSILLLEEIEQTVKSIFDMPSAKRDSIVGLSPKRSQVIAPGGTLLLGIMDYLNIDRVTVSETDNLEGYAKLNNLF